jgi:hypothetical protein
MPNPAAMRTRVSQLAAHPSEVPGLACRVRLAPLRSRAAALLAVICMIFASPMRAQSASITILVYDYVQVPPGTLREAERHADKILAKAGVSVNWVHCFAPKSLSADSKALCDTSWTAQTPALRFISGTNRLQPREYADTAVPVLITVYYDTIAHTWHHGYTDAEIPAVLGCVMAHELGHLLLRDASHSSTGIMQSEWSRDQMRLAIWGASGFTKDQLTRIQSQARILARLQPSD